MVKKKHASLLIPIICLLIASNTFSKSYRFQRLVSTSNTRGTILYLADNFLFPKNWHHHDVTEQNLMGVSTDLAYETYPQIDQGPDIIVAVIDSGVDINHPDLTNKIWLNKGEIPNNNIDDDQNGYIDDIAGWNFLGNKKAMAHFKVRGVNSGYELERNLKHPQLLADSLEITRVYNSLLVKSKKNVVLSPDELDELDRLEDEILSKRKRAKKLYENYQLELLTYNKAKEVLTRPDLSVDKMSLEEIENIEASSDMESKAKEALLNFARQNIDLEYLAEQVKLYKTQYLVHYNINSSERETLVDDNPQFIRDT